MSQNDQDAWVTEAENAERVARVLAESRDILAEKLDDCFSQFSDEEIIQGAAASATFQADGVAVYAATEFTDGKLDSNASLEEVAKLLEGLIDEAVDRAVAVVSDDPEDAHEAFKRKFHWLC